MTTNTGSDGVSMRAILCLIMMGLILIAPPFVFAQNYSAQKQPVYVYGQMSCGWTKHYLQELKKAKVPLVFKDVKSKSTSQEMWNKLESIGFSEMSVSLPVIVYKGQTSVRPDLQALIASAKK